MFIQFVGSVHKAWQITQISTSHLVALVALASFSGRLLMGGTTDLMQVSSSLSRHVSCTH